MKPQPALSLYDAASPPIGDQLYHEVFDSLDEGVLLLDRELRVADFNPAAERILNMSLRGASLDELLNLRQVLATDDRSNLDPDNSLTFHALRERPPRQREFALHSPLRGMFWVSVKVQPLRNGDGRIEGILIVLRDITAQRRREQESREQDELLASIMDNLAEGLMVVDRAGRFLLSNPAAERITGITPADLPLAAWPERYGIYRADGQTLCSPEELPLVRALREPSPVSAELVIRNSRLAESVCVEVSAGALKNRDGEIHGAIMVLRDVTAARRAAAALRASEEKFRKIFDLSPDLVSLNSALDGRYLAVNNRFLEYFHLDLHRVLGQRPFDIFEGVEALEQFARLLRNGGSLRNYEIEAGARGGMTSTMLMSAVPTEAAGEPCKLTFARDITELKAAREELQAESRRLTRVLAAQRAIAEADLSRDAVMRELAERAQEVIGADWAIVAELDGDDLICRALSGQAPAAVGQRLEGHGLGRQTIDEARVQLCTDGRSDPGIANGWPQAPSLIALPLRYREDSSCVLQVGSDRAEAFTLRDQNTLELLVAFGGGALAHAWQFENCNELVARLGQSEERFRLVFSHSHVGLCICDPSGRILEVNESYSAVLGYTRQELTGMNLNDLVHPEDRASAMRAFRQLISGEVYYYQIENRCLTARDDVVWLSVSATVSRDAAGGVYHVLISAVDTTERRRSQEQLAQSEAKFRKVFEENLSLMALASYPNGTLLEVNHEWDRLFGISREDLIGKKPGELGLWRDKSRLVAALDELRRYGAVRDRIDQFTGKQGAIVTLLYSWLLTTFQKRPCIMIIGNDITARKATEDARGLLASIIESALEAIISITPGGAVTSWNPGAQRLSGYGASQVIGSDCAIHLAPESRVEFNRVRQQVIGEGVAAAFEGEVLKRDGGRVPVALAMSPIRDALGRLTGLTLVGRDLTERNLAEQARELARSNEELQQFSYAASHDLKEPLRMIGAYAQLLKRRLAARLQGETEEFFGYIVEGVARMTRLLDGLLEYSRVSSESIVVKPVDCTLVVRAALSSLQSAIAESGAQIKHSSLPTINGSQQMLRRLMIHLIGNAIQFRGPQPPVIEIEAERLRRDWRFVVRDNGIGIDPRYAQRIFEMLERLHTWAEYPGSGLGLATCRKIVERHKGRLWVESRPGEGSSFYFTLPALGGN